MPAIAERLRRFSSIPPPLPTSFTQNQIVKQCGFTVQQDGVHPERGSAAER